MWCRKDCYQGLGTLNLHPINNEKETIIISIDRQCPISLPDIKTSVSKNLPIRTLAKHCTLSTHAQLFLLVSLYTLGGGLASLSSIVFITLCIITSEFLSCSCRIRCWYTISVVLQPALIFFAVYSFSKYHRRAVQCVDVEVVHWMW